MRAGSCCRQRRRAAGHERSGREASIPCAAQAKKAPVRCPPPDNLLPGREDPWLSQNSRIRWKWPAPGLGRAVVKPHAEPASGGGNEERPGSFDPGRHSWHSLRRCRANRIRHSMFLACLLGRSRTELFGFVTVSGWALPRERGCAMAHVGKRGQSRAEPLGIGSRDPNLLPVQRQMTILAAAIKPVFSSCSGCFVSEKQYVDAPESAGPSLIPAARPPWRRGRSRRRGDGARRVLT
jgi:hypothetical protein